MGDDPNLPKMPKRPTLVDFFERRFAPANHLLQSAALALKAGVDEEIVLACLLHDVGVFALARSDHGYWGAQLVEPYVSERVSWAIRYHQALRFFPDPSVGYDYPDSYIRYFGSDYEPEPYVKKAAEYAKNHKPGFPRSRSDLTSGSAPSPDRAVSAPGTSFGVRCELDPMGLERRALIIRRRAGDDGHRARERGFASDRSRLRVGVGCVRAFETGR